MNRIDAIEISAECKGQYPFMTAEQIRNVEELLIPFSQGAGQRALLDMAREIPDWNTARFIAIVKRHQIEIYEERTREQRGSRHQSEHQLETLYQNALDNANASSDMELKGMMETLFSQYPSLRAWWEKKNPKVCRPLALMLFNPVAADVAKMAIEAEQRTPEGFHHGEAA